MVGENQDLWYSTIERNLESHMRAENPSQFESICHRLFLGEQLNFTQNRQKSRQAQSISEHKIAQYSRQGRELPQSYGVADHEEKERTTTETSEGKLSGSLGVPEPEGGGLRIDGHPLQSRGDHG